MRPQGSPDQLEKRRRRAVALLTKGESYREVAWASGASLSSVVRWFQAFRRKGLKGLESRPTPGRPCRLLQAQRKQLEKLLLQGAQRAGYSTDLWTLRRISKLIQKEFGVRYSSSAVWRLLVVDLEWSSQKPERRDTQRDQAVNEEWKRTQFPQVKKKRVGWVPMSHP